MRAGYAQGAAAVIAGSIALFDETLGANTATPFDGSWSAVIITQSGGCDRSTQLSGQIINGVLVSPAGCVTVSARVKPDGALSGKASMGPYYVTGSGRLLTNSGSGTWQGVAPAGPCSGIWNAKRE
jgi:hypothetical protein